MSHADLIARLEALSGPDRELDEKIQAWSVGATAEWQDYKKSNAYHRDGSWVSIGEVQPFTASLDAAVGLVERVLPGWGWRIATCCVSDDAWVFPDFNSPAHGERLRREFREDIDWVDLTDVDLRPSGRPAIALLIATLKALDQQHD